MHIRYKFIKLKTTIFSSYVKIFHLLSIRTQFKSTLVMGSK
jgi:hypothetical protein